MGQFVEWRSAPDATARHPLPTIRGTNRERRRDALSSGPTVARVWCRERLAGYKVPKTVDVVSELPRNPTGKILKRELRKPYWEGRERQVV